MITTLRLDATFDTRTGRPQGYAFSAYATTREAGQEFAAQFPKAAKVIAGCLVGNANYAGIVKVTGDLKPNGTTGELNETALRRYRTVVRTCAKLGIAIEYRTLYGNSYETREAFEADIA